MSQYGSPPHQQPHYPPPQLGYQSSGGWGPRRASGLGISSLIVGIVALAAALVPCCGMVVAIPLGIIGGALGLVGFIAAGSGGQTPRGMPLAGMIVSVAALALSFAWPLIFSAIPTPKVTVPPPAFPGTTSRPTTQPAATNTDDPDGEPDESAGAASPAAAGHLTPCA